MSEDLAKYLAQGASTPKHPLDRFTNRIVTNLLMRYCVPWLEACLTKYSEYDFHMRMLDPSFDFVNDWYTNHPKKYRSFLSGARKLRHRFTFDTDQVLQRVMYAIQVKSGLNIYPSEVIRLRDTIDMVRMEIYS